MGDGDAELPASHVASSAGGAHAARTVAKKAAINAQSSRGERRVTPRIVAGLFHLRQPEGAPIVGNEQPVLNQAAQCPLTLGGVGAGVTLGGLAGAVIGSGIPEYEAKRYEGRVKHGGILLSVHCDNAKWARNAKRVLKQTGARDISTAQEARADFARSDKPMPRRNLRSPVEQ